VAEKVVHLNPYQRAVVDFRSGYAIVQAAPGSGKTACIVQRVQALLREGVQPCDILSLTFTNSAAKEMTERVDLKCPEKIFSTFHSWALAFIKREAHALPFKVKTDWHGAPAPLLLPLDACRILAKICRYLPDKVQWKDAQSFISRMKRQGISPSQAYRSIENDGEEKFVAAYAKYEAALREQGVLDFDNIVIQTVLLLEKRKDVRDRNQFRFVQADEGQDTDEVQLRLLKAITEKHGNCIFVGDVNQCQPPDTWVTNSDGVQTRLDTLRDSSHVRSWTKHEQRVYKTARSVRTASRWYAGPMLKIAVGENQTRMTPGHQMWVRFTKKARGARIVYLMWRPDLGFRVGTTWLRNKHGHSMFMHRGLVEKAERLWVLSVEKSGMMAQAKEQMITVKYGIPYSGFEPPYTPLHTGMGNGRTPELIKKIFACASAVGGYRCLADHNRSWEHPFVTWPTTELVFRPNGYFKTTAANLLPAVMALPTPEVNGSCVLDSVVSEPYEGMVFSLDVEKDHTYVADGIVVGNCMYSWRGALSNLENSVRALFNNVKTLPLAINYRSTQSIVDYCKEIAPNRNASVTDLTTPNEKGIEPVFRLYAREDEEAKAVILGCQDLGNTAVLARTNRQLGVVENECANRGLRYKLLGKSGYWSQREIKDVVSIIGAVVRPIDANVMGALKARCEMTKFIRKADGHGTKGVPTLLKEMQAREVGKASLYSLLCRYRGDGADAVNNLGHQLRSLRSEVSRLSGADGAKRIIERFGVLSSYDEDDNKDENVDNDPRDNIMKLVEYAGKKKSVDEFFEWTCKVQRGLRARTDALALGTIHAAKGKEWPTVFVIGVNQDVLPHIKGDLEEECRIYFVACSRAAKRLCVSANGVPSELIRHKLPERDNGVIDIWDGFTLLQR